MRVIDAGHQYALDHLDGNMEELLTFVKREGDKYPGNRGSHPGTNMQEVIRALIDRTQYLNLQVPHPANNDVMSGLRDALYALEVRAAERHGRPRPEYTDSFEDLPTCRICGHVECAVSHDAPAVADTPAAQQSDIILALRKKIHLTEKHNQYFERCESRWCNPTGTLSSGPGTDEALEPHVGDPFAMSVQVEVEKRLKEMSAAQQLDTREREWRVVGSGGYETLQPFKTLDEAIARASELRAATIYQTISIQERVCALMVPAGPWNEVEGVDADTPSDKEKA